MPKSPSWILTIDSQFSASHSLRNYGGKCEALHGHNFGVSIRVRGSKLDPKTEILVDFTDLKRELATVLKLLDHKHLNEAEPFTAINPSSENLSRFIYQKMEQALEPYGVRMVSATVTEKPGQSATYTEE